MDKIGKYQILEKLGQGGMGVVYKSLDTLIERIVAVKLVSSNLNDDPELRARFFREGRCAGQLSHKNIVTIFDLGEDDGRAYIAMEFLEGRDLRSEISKGRPIDLREKVRLMREVCEGLEHAHEKSVIHRDIKPANIFITRAGQVKILDFGLARTLSSELTTSGKAMGTPNYMSPEQIRGEKVDHRADIFSVGVVFYELLTRKKAFQGDSFTSTIYKILQGDPQPLEEIDPTIPAELCSIVYKALAKDREQRYQTLGDLLKDLEAYCRSPHFGLVPETDAPHSIPPVVREVGSDPGMTPARAAMSAAISRSEVTISGGGAMQSPLRAAGSRSGRQSSEDPPTPDLREEQTQMDAIPHSPQRPMTQRRLVTGAVALVAVAFLAVLFARYRSGKSVDPPHNQPPASVQTPTAPPKSQAPVQPVIQSPPPAALVEKEPAKPAPPTEREVHRNPEPARAQPDQSARQGADQVRGQLAGLRSKADGAHASEFASRSFEAAATAEVEANRLYTQGKFVEAAIRAGEAAGLYRSAESEARSERSRRAEQERQKDLSRARGETGRQGYERERDLALQAGAPGKSRDQFGEAEKIALNARAKFDAGDFEGAAHDYETAAASMRRAHSIALEAGHKEAPTPAEPPKKVPAPAPPVAQPAADAGDSVEAARRAISSIPDQYKAAMEGKNLDLLKSIWPALSAQQEQAYMKQWAYTRSLRIIPQRLNIDKMEGDSAIVSVQLHYEQEINDGTNRKWDQKATFSLGRKGRSWVIENASFQATR